jgi:predicted CXXCH cytochrome family protein
MRTTLLLGREVALPAPRFTAEGKPMVTWQGGRYVLTRIRVPRDCARCHEPLDTRQFVYLGNSGRALCQGCVVTIDACRSEEGEP